MCIRDRNDVIQVCQRDQQSFQDVRPSFSLCKLKFGSSGDDVLAVFEVSMQSAFEGEKAGFAVNEDVCKRQAYHSPPKYMQISPLRVGWKASSTFSIA